MRIFYSPNQGDESSRYSCVPNFLELRNDEVRHAPFPRSGRTTL